MLRAWMKMKDREELIKEELRLFGSSELLEMISGGYNARISYDPSAGVVNYSSKSCLPGRQDMAKFSLEARQMGCQVNARCDAGKKSQTLEFIINSNNGKEIRVSSTLRPGNEIIARTSVEFPYSLNLCAAYLLYRLASLYEMDYLERFPYGRTPEILKVYLAGYLTEETATDACDKQDIPKPFRQVLGELGF